MASGVSLFDYNHQRSCRERAARNWSGYDFLVREVAQGLVERWKLLRPCNELVVDLGCHGAEIAQAASDLDIKVQNWLVLDPAQGFTRLARENLRHEKPKSPPSRMKIAQMKVTSIATDYESLPLADACVDVLLSGFYLHWINNLPALLTEIRRVLKPGGLFLASLAGAGTLNDLRHSLIQAESLVRQGASIRVSPFLDIQMAGRLLQHAQFKEPVLSRETLKIEHRDLQHLMHDLRGMGQTNAHRQRERHCTPAQLFVEAQKLYPQQRNGISSVFDILSWSAWAP